ncbi:MAG TPA: calcium/sodium antiporter [Bacteriovoracaceae bacterium]|nr:calcium/sodium antiporter [Bacteriovoracaceae bacterium]
MIILFIVIGLVVLTYGADIFVNGASKIAVRFNISPVAIGLTIVAFGTSAPELSVNIISVMQGNPDIALGNVVGSNIFNIVLILGLCGVIMPLTFSRQLIRFDIPLMIVASVMLWIFGRDFKIGFIESAIFAALIIGYTYLQFKSSKANVGEVEEDIKAEGSVLMDVGRLLLGLGMLIGGAKLFVSGAVDGARLLGMSEAVIGLTIVAAGTSLPEVATSVVATIRGQRDIAIGNVVGSNIFNIFSVLGFSGLLASQGLSVNEHIQNIDIPLMIGVSLLTFIFAFSTKKLNRPMGAIFLLIYIGYTYYLIQK